jgi:hypothetical protein
MITPGTGAAQWKLRWSCFVYRATTLAIALPASASHAAAQTLPDSSIFAAVARQLADSFGVSLRIDPRPLNADPQITLVDMTSDYAPATEAQIDGRVATLRRIGAAETRAPVAGGCPGALVPMDDRDPGNPKSKFCPKQLERLVAVALPRAGGAYHPHTNHDERTSGSLLGYVAVRIIVVTRSPAGASTVSADMVFRRTYSGWELVKVQRLIIVE